MANSLENSLRKAAVFLGSLAPDKAEALLARLSADEATSLRAAVASLGDVRADERRRVADEARARSTHAAAPAAEPAPSRPSVVQSADEGVVLELRHNPEPIAPPPTPPLPQATLAERLSGADPVEIAAFLASEQPRAVSVVLSLLPPGLAASVLGSIAVERRAEVLLQLASLGDADPSSVSVLASGLAEWLAGREAESRRRADRLATVRAILAATPEEDRRLLVQSLALNEPELAASLLRLVGGDGARAAATGGAAPSLAVRAYTETVGAGSVEASEADAASEASRQAPPERGHPSRAESAAIRAAFDRLEGLDERTLAEAFAQLDARTALLALAAASERMIARVASRLPRDASRRLRRRIAELGPTSLGEIEQAQHALLASAARVVSRTLPVGGARARRA